MTRPLEEGLASLQAHYMERIDTAVAAGRMDLVGELADGYEDEAVQLMLTVEGGALTQPSHRTAEILQFGRVPPHRSRSERWRFWRHKRR